MRISYSFRRRIVFLLLIFALAITVRSLTGNFLREHFDDPGWFQSGPFNFLDRQADDILSGRTPVFWIDDSTRTDRMVYPPAYPIWLATIQLVTGDRSPVMVQRIQLVLDSLGVLLLVGIGTAAFDWRVGVVAGVLGALSPTLALPGATPNADAPTAWLVLTAVWLLLMAAKRKSVAFAAGAGAVLGLACWIRVNPFLLFIAWAAALSFFIPASRGKRLKMAAATALATLFVMSPIIIRNIVVFYPDVAPTGLNVGLNLWEGIGETERGAAEFGAPETDVEVVEQESVERGLPPDPTFSLNYPDGIRREHERAAKALAVIKAHPVWYSGTMLNRMWGHLKFAGKPVPHVGTMGFNVTSSKCLPPEARGGMIGFGVTLLGMIQSVWRYMALPLMIIGIGLGFRRDWRITAVLLATVLYYLATLAVGHSEIRYGIPMQALLIVFAAVSLVWIKEKLLVRTSTTEGDGRN